MPIAVAQMAAPTNPHSVPKVKPRWRPTRFMCSEAGMVPIAPPRIQQVTGSVAIPAYGASANPARPLIAMRVELLVNNIAWHAASRPTLRLVLVIYTVSPMDAKQDSRYLRGARSFVQGRFETDQREPFDDGWTPKEKDERPLE